MDPFMVSSTTTLPTPAVDVGQGFGTPQVESHHCSALSSSNSRVTSYDDLARFDPFNIDFIDSPPLLPDATVDPTVAFSPEELSYLNPGQSMLEGSLGGHIQSWSMDSDLMDYIEDREGFAGASEDLGGNDALPANTAVHPAQGACMDGSANTVSTETEQPMANEAVKKAMPNEKLAELAVLDPKRAKRIIANRQSAARSKERKIRHRVELEKKVDILQADSAVISDKVEKIQKENSDLEAEKKDIVRDVESMDGEAKVREELNRTLRDKLRVLKKEYKEKVAYKRLYHGRMVSYLSSDLAVYQAKLLRFWQGQQQLGMPPSRSDQPDDSESDSDESSSDSEN
ncbi:hypothetical protein QN277_011899 [Acacia crassicarpa]|uniref:BZIP domain-containing protein n=1 Tax=Acacia crassicarpa TaxID=499986 RepID=A0AAE1N008_9FABA|nr:hypothetical protein QN277_011899 [Acacia crassicarpa]